MLAALHHRGPDDRGIAVIERGPADAPAVLVHTRLSIVDLSAAGHQPMLDAGREGEGPLWITFNGEIYNFRELAAELAALGRPCTSRCDTEVILKAYRTWGVRAVERFEGMFAFCLLDVARGVAWLARDRVGIKPLYTFRPSGGGLVFASEVRALLAAGPELVPRRLRPGAVESFLAQGAVMGEQAIVQGVSLLPPGETLLCDFRGNPQRQVRYWSVAFGRDAGANARPADGSVPTRDDFERAGSNSPARFRAEVVAELQLALRRAVNNQLLADVPVGLFLSSGIDSSAIAAIASEVASRPLASLSVGFDVPEFDETEGARATAEELGTVHRSLRLTGQDVLSSFDRVLEAVDQPTVDGFNTYHVAGAARRAGLTVALSGVGGDELFGGYATFRDVPRGLRVGRASSLAASRRRDAIARHLRKWASAPRLAARGRALAKLSSLLERPVDPALVYFLRRELFSTPERRALSPLPFGSDPWSGVDEESLDALRSGHAERDVLDQVAAFEFGAYMRHMLLRDTDVFSMAHALEVRVPLLEHYAVEQAARARSVWRKPDPRPKPLLVDATGVRLPARAIHAKKRGFTFPWLSWLRGPLRDRAESALSGAGLEAAGLDRRAVSRLWERFCAGDPTLAGLQILGLVVLESHVRRHGLSA